MTERVTMAKRGMSLVEVLVVLVVLVIGIFGVALLFPSGFGSIRYTENTTTAQTLARANEEYNRGRAANLPQGILALRFDPVAKLMVIDPTADPTQSFTEFTYGQTDNSGPPNVIDPRFSGQNRWRHVEGEVVRIPPPTTGSPYYPNAAISLYTLTLGPVYSTQVIPTSSLGVIVYSASPMQQVVLSNPPQSAADN